jgi:hypothetical protein
LRFGTIIKKTEYEMTDKVRASREGHHFHEAWTARRALELFAPVDDLAGIAIEGLAPADLATANQETIDIADLALYYGDTACTFDTCTRQHILQFKYSISDAQTAATASDMSKTLSKFAASEKALLDHHRGTATMDKRRYGIVTNRPISGTFLAAVEHVRNNTNPNPKEKALWNQYRAFRDAVSLESADIADFARRLDFQGGEDNVTTLNRSVRKRLASWSASDDVMATMRLQRLCDMVRGKCESRGERCNVIRRADVLDALDVSDEKELLPVPPAFPPVGNRVVRAQTREILELIPSLTAPLLIHAPGGTGKTVLMQSLEASAPPNFEVVLFDCFAGGAYRTLGDGRHRLGRGLMHIVNQLAAKGLCDPLLPYHSDASALLGTFRKRITQAVETLRANRADSYLVLLIDAADNAAQEARDRRDDAFPVALVESAGHLPLPAHVRLVLSCRTERQALLGAGRGLRPLAVQGFTRAETAEYVRAAIADVSESDIDIAVARSAGNPRVLSHLVRYWEELIRRPESHEVLAVEDLIAQRVDAAVKDTADRGAGHDNLMPYLAGLAVLPPPIPLADYADANGISPAQAQSMFADLSPLLEITSLGVIFRDEPTETLVRTRYGHDQPSLCVLAQRLDAIQEKSQYACYALPGLLKQLGNVQAAIDLAYSQRLPHERMSDVGKRTLRILRIRTALGLAVRNADPATLAGLLGDRFIAANPDLVALTDDVDAMRRLFKLRTLRPESRHACLNIVHLLKGDSAEAARHAARTAEWATWRSQKDKSAKYDQDDLVFLVARPLDHLARGEFEAAFALIAELPQETGFAIAAHLFTLARQLPEGDQLAGAYAALCASPVAAPSLFAAALATWQDRDAVSETALVQQLARSLVQVSWKPKFSALDTSHCALLDAAAIALRLGLGASCDTLLATCSLRRPDARAFAGNAHGTDLVSWVFYTIIKAVRQGRAPTLRDLLPAQMHALAANYDATPQVVAGLLAQQSASDQDADEDEAPESMASIFGETILPLMDLAGACAKALSAGSDASAARDLVAAWERLPRHDEEGKRLHTSARHLDAIGRELTLRTLGVCHQFTPELAERCLGITDPGHSWSIPAQISQVERFATVSAMHAAACELAESVAEHIANKQGMTWRSEAYALLARAILPASPDEAKALYRRGLSVVDEIVVSDTAILSQVFAFTANLKGLRLDPVRAYRFIRLCTSCFAGSYVENFPWHFFGQAAAAALGEAALVLLGQWAQEGRGRVDLDTSLAPVVTALLERDMLDVAPALALFMLDVPRQWYTLTGEPNWVFKEKLDGGTASALLERAGPDAPVVLDALLRHAGAASDSDRFPLFFIHEFLKRCTASRVLPETDLARLRTLLTENSPLYRARSVDGRAPPEAGNEAQRAELVDGIDAAISFASDIASGTDIENTDAIALAWSKFKTLGTWAPDQTIFDALQSQVGHSRRRRYLEALASARLPADATVARLAALEECLRAWAKTAAVQEIRPLLASRLVSADPASLAANPYAFDMVLERLARFGPTSIGEVAKDVIESICMHELDADTTVWMTLAAVLAADVDASRAQEIGARLFDSRMAHIAAKGDQREYTGWPKVSIDPAEGVAGLIWLRLGDANSADRARATGAVVLLAEHERWSELDRLAARCEARDAGQFGNPAYPFCYLHARYSLTTGLAIAASRYPSAMQRYRETFSRLLRASPSHPLLRSTVLKGLAALGTNDMPLPRLAEGADPDGQVSGKGAHAVVFEEEQREFGELARVFSLDTSRVADLVAMKIVQWDPDVKHVGKNYQPIDWFSDISEYQIASMQQQYVAHLCWHASFVVGDELAAFYADHQRAYDRQGWDEMVARHVFFSQS